MRTSQYYKANESHLCCHGFDSLLVDVLAKHLQRMELKDLLLLLLSAAVHFQLSNASATLSKRSLTPPSEDPFYDCPKNQLSQPPGSIIRHRVSLNPLGKYDGLPTNVKQTYQLLYVTSDIFSNPTRAVTTIVVPEKADFTKLISYQAAYNSANVDYGPSYQFLQGATKNTTGAIDELEFIATLLGSSWTVNIPDYEGLDAAYEAGLATSHAVLDSVRAALQSESITGIFKNATYAMWGYSGGSYASQWAAELQSSYAPDLSFVGTAVGGTTPNLTSVYLTINGQPYAGLNVVSILGLSKQYANFSRYLDTHLISSKASEFRYGERKCFLDVIKKFANKNVSHYFTDGESFLYDTVCKSVLENSGLLCRHGTPQMPLYIYKAVHDEISPIADTDALVKQYCAEGLDVQYVRDHKGNHEHEAAWGAPRALAFLEYVMGGYMVQPGCNITNVGTK